MSFLSNCLLKTFLTIQNIFPFLVLLSSLTVFLFFSAAPKRKRIFSRAKRHFKRRNLIRKT
ncbi:MAG: hypothetical protein D6780_00640 [Candidatus Dadabacteria bacterium]|nr:MAG: hypothetical protein D6780_00640 [Candidatus Dadabacteria bacterium]